MMDSIVTRQWKVVSLSGIFGYAIAVVIERSIHNSSQSLQHCNEYLSTSQTSLGINQAVFTAFVMSIFIEIWLAWGARGNGRLIHVIPVMINSIASCEVVFNIWSDDGFCKDSFGVYSNRSRWPQWMVTVPLLVYCVLAFDSAHNLCWLEVLVIVSMGSTILFAWLLTLGPSHGVSVFLLLMSVAEMSIMCWYAFRLKFPKHTEPMEGIESPQRQIDRCMKKLKADLLVLLTAMMLVFPLIYLLEATKALEREAALNASLIAGAVVKISFTVALITANSKVTSFSEAVYSSQYEASMQANQSKSKFLRSVFHDARVPLNSIVMGLAVFDDADNLTATQLETLEMMCEACGFMSETLDGVLSMEKIEAGHMTLEYLPFKLSRVVNRVIKSLTGTAQKKQVTLLSKVSISIPKGVLGDRFRLEHVLANLISNAVKFSPPNSQVIVSVYTKEEKEATPQSKSYSYAIHDLNDVHPTHVTVCMAVTDSGAGMSPADQANLFKPFHQANAGALQQGGGTGLGLAICKEIVELHGGTICCESEVGVGTTFTVTIRFKLPDSGQDISCSWALPPEEMVQAVEPTDCVSIECGDVAPRAVVTWLELRCLVTDDAKSNRRILVTLLERQGFQCEQAVDGQQALDAIVANGKEYDVVFMDKNMPVLGGAEATCALRQSGFDQFIIGLTGSTFDDEIKEFLVAGVDVVFSKPFTKVQMQALLAHLKAHGTKSDPSVKWRVVDGTFKLFDMNSK